MGAALALVVPLAGCGATDQTAEAAGGKAGGSVPAEPVVLRMLNPAGEGESEAFVSAVDRVSGGALRIDVVDRWHSDDPAAASREPDSIEAVRAGAAPLGLTAVRAWHDQDVRSFDALVAPMLIDRVEVQAAVLHSDVTTDMLAALDGSGLTGIGILPGPMQHPVGVTRDLLDVADYRGASIAIPPGAVLTRSVQDLGATPTATLFGGAPVAGYDGFEQQLSSVQGNQYDDAARSVTTNVTVRPRPLVLYGNTDALAALSEQNRAYLHQAALATIDPKIANDHSLEAEDVGVLCRRGLIAFLNATPEQVAALRTAYEPTYRWLREDAATGDFLDRIQRIADATPVDPGYAPSCDNAPGPAITSPESAAPGPVDGTYTLTVTQEDLDANGVPRNQQLPENWGDSVSVYDRGRFATTQHNDLSCTWAYGQFTLDGDTLTMDYQGGGGQSPTGSTNKPGEELVFDWSLYRDVLTLTHHEGGISPVPEGQQWPLNRISPTPDPGALNQQCPPPAEAFAN